MVGTPLLSPAVEAMASIIVNAAKTKNIHIKTFKTIDKIFFVFAFFAFAAFCASLAFTVLSFIFFSLKKVCFCFLFASARCFGKLNMTENFLCKCH